MTEYITFENESAFFLKGKEYPMFYTLYVFTGKQLGKYLNLIFP